MLVLWIDPGVRKCGYALVDFSHNQKKIIDSGILFDDSKIETRMDWFRKMGQIISFFEKLSKEHSIEKIGIEKLYFTSRNQSNAEFVYGLRWGLVSFFFNNGIHIVEIDPVQVKKYISWNWKASKELVQTKIMQLYWLSQKPQYNDSADALGMSYLAYIIK